jgi:hypothetical protein
MRFTSLLVIVALFAATNVDAVTVARKKKKEEPAPTAADTPSSGYFGADEDDVMNNIFNHYAVPIKNAAGIPTGQKVLYKDGAEKACAEVLLVTKQVSEAKMESYVSEFFPRTWAKFDVNNSGEIDITELYSAVKSILAPRAP